MTVLNQVSPEIRMVSYQHAERCTTMTRPRRGTHLGGDSHCQDHHAHEHDFHDLSHGFTGETTVKPGGVEFFMANNNSFYSQIGVFYDDS